MTVSVATELANLKAAIDGALSPSGMLSELSRIIAEFAEPLPKWDATCPDGALRLDAECSSVRRQVHPQADPYVLADRPLRDFPLLPPRTGLGLGLDERSRATLREWSIRIDSAQEMLCFGIAKPPADPSDFDSLRDDNSWWITTHSSSKMKGAAGVPIGLPHAYEGEAAGSVYHFTADLKTGELRVRPVVRNVSYLHKPSDPPKAEWTISRPAGIKDLASHRVMAVLRAETTACTLMFMPAVAE
jgi:hypothetical protein